MYTAAFKSQMVQKLTRPGGPRASELSREVGVHTTTLLRWVREAVRRGGSDALNPERGATRAMPARRPQDWTAQEKLEAVIEAAQLGEEELGAFLRRKGLHEAHLAEWRRRVLAGLERPALRSPKASGEARRIQELERELGRKEKALAEAAALLVLQKKVRALWGDEDDGTAPKNGRRS